MRVVSRRARFARNAKIEWRKVVAVKDAAGNDGPLTAIGEAASTPATVRERA